MTGEIEADAEVKSSTASSTGVKEGHDLIRGSVLPIVKITAIQIARIEGISLDELVGNAVAAYVDKRKGKAAATMIKELNVSEDVLRAALAALEAKKTAPAPKIEIKTK